MTAGFCFRRHVIHYTVYMILYYISVKMNTLISSQRGGEDNEIKNDYFTL